MTKVLGRAERVDFADYGLHDIPAKVDTGAYSSSIDCSKVELRNGELEFILFHPSVKGYTGELHHTQEFDTTEVKNANGVQLRYVIFPLMAINSETRRCRLTLADRSKLRYPVLIGRRFFA